MKKYILLLGVLGLGLMGCRPIKLVPLSSYVLEPQFNGVLHHAKTKATIVVASPVAMGGYDTTAMIYVLKPYQLQAFAYNNWVAPPAKMLLPIIGAALGETNFFQGIVMASETRGQYVLQTTLLLLQQEFFTPISQLHMTVAVNLIDARDGRLLGQRIFSERVPAPLNNPYGGVMAANQAAHTLARRIALFCIRLITANS